MRFSALMVFMAGWHGALSIDRIGFGDEQVALGLAVSAFAIWCSALIYHREEVRS